MEKIYNSNGISISLLDDDLDDSVQVLNHIIPETELDDETQSLDEESQNGKYL